MKILLKQYVEKDSVSIVPADIRLSANHKFVSSE